MVSSGRTVVDLTLDPTSAAPSAARRAVADALGHHARCGDVLLCVSEAVTNAVVHARTRLRVTVREDGPLVRVEVTDEVDTAPVLRAPAPGTASGRGVALIDRLATRWGVEQLVGGKTVWFEVSG